jgi:hypothetical protein
VIRFAKGERKLEVMRPHLDRLVGEGRTGVAAIGAAQEFQRVFTGTTYHPDADGGGVPRFGYHKADRRVTAYYFYLVDEVFGPAFIKVCAVLPLPDEELPLPDEDLAQRPRVRQARRHRGRDRVHRAGQRVRHL